MAEVLALLHLERVLALNEMTYLTRDRGLSSCQVAIRGMLAQHKLRSR